MLVEVANGLVQPLAVRHAGDGSGRLFVVEQAGVIRIVDPATGTVLATPFLDLSAMVDSTAYEQGLLGLAFDPGYATNGLFYVSYTWDPAPAGDDDWTRLERYAVSVSDPDVAEAASALTLLELEQPGLTHNSGDLHFGPDGYLYVGSGDGGPGGDPDERGQDLGSLLGKILRLDVGEATAGSPYAIPPDNPFVGDGEAREIWAYGLRNPWRFSFDRLTGDLFLGDVGQNTWEEIDFQPASSTGGENYGWDCYEGPDPYVGPPEEGSTCSGQVVEPILSYRHEENDEVIGCAVTGGYRYRGHRVAGLAGTYVYADFCTGTLWLADETTPGDWSATPWSSHGVTEITSFGEDEEGELYLVSRGGSLFRLVSPGSVFADGFESGDTSAWMP
jgi:glucose/arabinose dehydrogenase